MKKTTIKALLTVSVLLLAVVISKNTAVKANDVTEDVDYEISTYSFTYVSSYGYTYTGWNCHMY